MNAVERAIRDVVIANRIVALNKVLDAYGHVNMRHPERHDRYFLARSISPAIAEVEDIIEFNLKFFCLTGPSLVIFDANKRAAPLRYGKRAYG